MSRSFDPSLGTIFKVSQLSPQIQTLAWGVLYYTWFYTGRMTQLTSGKRSLQEQKDLFLIGRLPGDDRPAVTQTIWGSKHLKGLAFDFDFQGIPPDNVPQDLWDTAGWIGQQLGLRWGGRWQVLRDFRHFEI